MSGVIRLGEEREFRRGEWVVGVAVRHLTHCPTWRWFGEHPGPLVLDLHYSRGLNLNLANPDWVHERFTAETPLRNIKLYLPVEPTQFHIGETGDLSHPSLPEQWLDLVIVDQEVQWNESP